MSNNVALLARRLVHLARMREYLAYSQEQASKLLPITNWGMLTADQHETLAAFRVRFSEFQEHLGKCMRAIALEEESPTEPFGAVLALMEKLGILDQIDHWKLIRELRNAINHEYEDDPERIAEFFRLLSEETPVLFCYHQALERFCLNSYNISAPESKS